MKMSRKLTIVAAIATAFAAIPAQGQLAAAAGAAGVGGFTAYMYGPPSWVTGTATSTMPIATPEMISGLGNWVGSQIQVVGETINAAQMQQSAIDAKLVDAANLARQNTSVQVLQGQIAAKVALAQPVDSNGANIRLQNNCGMMGGAPAIAAGLATNINNGTALASTLRNYNSDIGGFTQQQMITRVATMPAVKLAANSIIGDTAGAGVPPQNYSLQDVNDYITLTTNPTPLPDLPPAAAATPAGLRYQAIQNLQKAILDIPQQTLAGVAEMNSPTLPMGQWLQGELTQHLQAPQAMMNAFQTAGQIPTAESSLASQSGSNGASSPTVICPNTNSQAGCVTVGGTSGQNNISMQNFLYTMMQARVANPNWWTSLTKMNSSPPLLQEIAEIDALRGEMEYKIMVNLERIAAMQAQQAAATENGQMQQQAATLRTTAISQAGH